MRTIFMLLTLFLLLLFTVACGTDKPLPSPDENNTTAAQQTTIAPIESTNNTDRKEYTQMKVTVGEKTFVANLNNNSSAQALVELLKTGPLTIDMHDYGNFEKVGQIGQTLPRNDEHITTGPGDIILYQGNQLVLYYDTNTWDFTPIGNIPNVTTEQLLDVLGEGNVTVVFSLD